jgi:hypothetical protein
MISLQPSLEGGYSPSTEGWTQLSFLGKMELIMSTSSAIVHCRSVFLIEILTLISFIAIQERTTDTLLAFFVCYLGFSVAYVVIQYVGVSMKDRR